MKKIFLHGLAAGILSAVAGVIYFRIYQGTLGTAFNKVINPVSITGASIIGCILMAIGYAVLYKSGKAHLKGILNIVFTILSFASIIGPISMALPLGIEAPELFPGLVVPMHFFPALAFFAIAPFFQNLKTKNNEQ